MERKLINSILGVVVILIIFLSLVLGIFTVKTGEEAVVLRFGKHVSTHINAGLKWHIPFIDKVHKANLSEVNRIEFGFRTTTEGSSTSKPEFEDQISESLMLTGDEALVNAETIVQYKIKSAEDFYFNVDDPIATLTIISESIIRRCIANHPLDEVLTDNKFGIQQEIKDDLQKVADKYGLGIVITAIQLQDVNPPKEVDAAFKDVSSAREDKTSYINEANSYSNEIIPKARGNSAEMINKAEAYREQRVEESKGDASNFSQILEKYKQGKTVTRTRMYLETLEDILPNIDKYIMSEKGDTLKLLPLNEQVTLPVKEGN